MDTWMGANRPHTVPSLSAAVNRGNRTTERSMREPFEQDEYPIREGGRSVFPLSNSVRHGTLPTARSARSVSRRSIQLPYVTQRTSEGRRGTMRDVSPTSLRDSSPRFQFFPRIVATRSRGNVVVDRTRTARTSSGRLRPSASTASRTDFNAPLSVLFSLYTITTQFAAWISVKSF